MSLLRTTLTFLTLAASAAATAQANTVFATVNDAVISAAEYDAALAVAQRNRFYHGQVPEAQLQALRREVGDQLIDRVLLSAETEKQKIEPDRAKIDAELAGYERRYGSSPQWERMKAQALPGLVVELERRSRMQRLEEQVRQVAEPSDEALRRFYDEKKELFTEPEQVKVSVILLKVDPSSPKQAWEQARAEAASIRGRLQRGADFAELARLHSADASAANGGDLGYLHRGMLPEAAQSSVDKMALAEVSEPLTTLEGIVLLRVDDRRAAKLREFDTVKPRARQLWLREAGDAAWRSYLDGLRAAAQIKVVDTSRYPQAAGRTN